MTDVSTMTDISAFLTTGTPMLQLLPQLRNSTITRRPRGMSGSPKYTYLISPEQFLFAGLIIEQSYLFTLGESYMVQLFISRPGVKAALVDLFGEPETSDDETGVYDWNFGYAKMRLRTYPQDETGPVKKIAIYTPQILDETWAGLTA